MNADYEQIAEQAASAALDDCRSAKSHDGRTCIEATNQSAFWCPACGLAFQVALSSSWSES